MKRFVLTFVGLLVVAACAAPRVAPVGQIAPDPARPGEYTLNPALPQPEAEDYQPGAGLGWLSLLGGLLPSPWRELVGMGTAALITAPMARRAPLRALRQTVCGIEQAKKEAPDAVPALHAALEGAQDEDAKKLVWEMRP